MSFKIVCVDPLTDESVQFRQPEEVTHIGYFITEPTQGPRLTLTRILKPPFLLEDFALKYLKKILQAHLYDGDILLKSMEVRFDRYDVQYDGSLKEKVFETICFETLRML